MKWGTVLIATLAWSAIHFGNEHILNVMGKKYTLDFVPKNVWEDIDLLIRKSADFPYALRMRAHLPGILRTTATMLKMWDADAAICTDSVLEDMYATCQQTLSKCYNTVNNAKLGGSVVIHGKRYHVPRDRAEVEELFDFMAAYSQYLALKNIINFGDHYKTASNLEFNLDKAKEWNDKLTTWADVRKYGHQMACEVFG